MAMLNTQLTDLENRHEYVKSNYVDNASHTEFVGGEYLNQIVEDLGDQEYLNNLVRRQLLDVRSDGTTGFPGEEPDNEEEAAKVARAKSDATVRANNYDEVSGIHDTEQLLRRLGVRNRRERHALNMELRESLDRESSLTAKVRLDTFLSNEQPSTRQSSTRRFAPRLTLFAIRFAHRSLSPLRSSWRTRRRGKN